MELYAVIGCVECPGFGDDHTYFYGVFSNEENAKQIIDNLKSKP